MIEEKNDVQQVETKDLRTGEVVMTRAKIFDFDEEVVQVVKVSNLAILSNEVVVVTNVYSVVKNKLEHIYCEVSCDRRGFKNRIFEAKGDKVIAQVKAMAQKKAIPFKALVMQYRRGVVLTRALKEDKK